MKKILSVLGALLVFAGAGWAGQEHPGLAGPASVSDGPAPQKDATRLSAETGTALLDLFIDTLRDMSARGMPEDLDSRLQEIMLAARKARETDTVDAVFFLRFHRMLAVLKLVAVPDKTGVLAPVIGDVLSDFVEDKLGHRGFREEGGKGPKAVNYVAQALSAEFIDLQIYLDTLDKRQTLQKKIEERMAAPKK